MARFVSSFEVPEGDVELRPTDSWILGELNVLVEKCATGYDAYNFFEPANRCREFLWNVFAPHYMEMVKTRAYAGDAGAIHTLHEGVRTMLRLLAPITPFVTDRIWSTVYGGSVQQESIPRPREEWGTGLTDRTAALVEFNSMVWKTKKESGKSLKEPIIGVAVPAELEPFAAELTSMHKLEKAT